MGNASWADTAAAVCRSSGCDCDVEILAELLPLPCCLRCCVLALGAALVAAKTAEGGPTAPVVGASASVTEYSSFTLNIYELCTDKIGRTVGRFLLSRRINVQSFFAHYLVDTGDDLKRSVTQGLAGHSHFVVFQREWFLVRGR